MSFSVQIAQDLVQVEPGMTVALSIEIANRGDDRDQFELMVEGLDPEWTAVPDPAFFVEKHDIQSGKVFLKPPRTSESVAGTYPFVVRVRSLESGEARTAQAALEIKSYHHISVDITPRRGTVTQFKKACPFQVTIMNLGNSEQTMQLFASDPESDCVCEFEQERVSVPPGAQKTVQLSVSSTRNSLFSGARLHSLNVSARSSENPTIVGSAQAQLEQRALMTPSTLIFTILLALLAYAWIRFMPGTPQIDRFTAYPREVTLGDPIMVSWSASNAKAVRILVDGVPVADQPPLGQMQVKADHTGEIVVTCRPISGDKVGAESSPEKVVVNSAPTIPAPEIESFKITPRKLKVGDTFVVSYKVRNATKLTLAPIQESLDPRVTEREMKATRAGNITFTLLAENSKGETAQKSLNVVVEETSKVQVVTFTVFPKELEAGGGTIRVTWTLQGAVNAELKIGDKTQQIDPSNGNEELLISETTTITLVATDDNKQPIERTYKVVVKPLPDSSGGEPTSPPTTTGGGN